MAYFGMGGNWNSRARYLSCYPQYTFCLVWLDTVIQNHEQTIARITRSMALYGSRLLYSGIRQRRNAVPQLHTRIYSFCPLFYRTLYRQTNAKR